ncbi:hypothetical protein DNTS_012311 [Danionella cerebrum]|uniref:Cohesin loading complex subunit SCC4 homolog n=1 Tax=Danionella cerebrum TaxID=2873325 RepID=A0A553REU0_9TELE|nr:hypothetical protein DNTS_012311 [Danionella translucida]
MESNDSGRSGWRTQHQHQSKMNVIMKQEELIAQKKREIEEKMMEEQRRAQNRASRCAAAAAAASSPSSSFSSSSNKFVNDGSFLQQFLQMQREKASSGPADDSAPPAQSQNSIGSSSVGADLKKGAVLVGKRPGLSSMISQFKMYNQSKKSPGVLKPRPCVFTSPEEEEEEEEEGDEHFLQLKVPPPEDGEQRVLACQFARFIADGGSEQEHKENPLFSFLWDRDSVQYLFYRKRLAELRRERAAQSEGLGRAPLIDRSIQRQQPSEVARPESSSSACRMPSAIKYGAAEGSRHVTAADPALAAGHMTHYAMLKVSSSVDEGTRKVAEKLARFVADGGTEVEIMAMENNRENPAFSFLYDYQSAAHRFYKAKVEEFRQLSATGESPAPRPQPPRPDAQTQRVTELSDEQKKQLKEQQEVPLSGEGTAEAGVRRDPSRVFVPSQMQEMYDMIMKHKRAMQDMQLIWEKTIQQHQHEYDSDEEVDEQGTWEHRLRMMEMEKTREWAEQLTEMGKGKHFIGDFLPPDELEKFMETFKALKEGREPDFSEYKEFKLTVENIGFKMLMKMGWKEGDGLGSEGQGIKNPVNRGSTAVDGAGFGVDRPAELSKSDDEYDAFRKRMMLAYRFRPNPLVRFDLSLTQQSPPAVLLSAADLHQLLIFISDGALYSRCSSRISSLTLFERIDLSVTERTLARLPDGSLLWAKLKMAAGAEAPESWYLALLGFAEHFRTSSPPKIRLCVHCLQAVFQFKPPQRVEARTHLQLGSVLYHHTKNSELARTHLEKAVSRTGNTVALCS